MNFSIANVFMSLGAGIFSIASPCILPVVPIIISGKKGDHKLRPLFIVLGLSLSFMLMGVVSSLFGKIIAGNMYYVEKVAGGIIIFFGILYLVDINPFKKLSLLSGVQTDFQGIFSGFILGATLGLIWIPCIGPMLSSVLTLVATKGSISTGLVLLAFYSLGFSIPLLMLGHFSKFFREKVIFVSKNPFFIRILSGLLLIFFGVFVIVKGMV